MSNAQPEQSGHGEAATMPAGEAYPMCLISTTTAGSRMDQYGVSTLRLMAVEEELRLLSANEARLRWQQLRAEAARLAWQEALVSRLHAQREHRSQHSEPTRRRPTQPSRPWSAFASVAPRLHPLPREALRSPPPGRYAPPVVSSEPIRPSPPSAAFASVLPRIAPLPRDTLSFPDHGVYAPSIITSTEPLWPGAPREPPPTSLSTATGRESRPYYCKPPPDSPSTMASPLRWPALYDGQPSVSRSATGTFKSLSPRLCLGGLPGDAVWSTLVKPAAPDWEPRRRRSTPEVVGDWTPRHCLRRPQSPPLWPRRLTFSDHELAQAELALAAARRGDDWLITGRLERAAASERKLSPGRCLLSDGAPEQVMRAVSPELMSWVYEKLHSMDANAATLTTHDTVHGQGEKWCKKRYDATGFGYGPPRRACIRMLTAEGRTSLYHFLTQHAAGESLRVELCSRFGDDWQAKCFGRATHMLSHSWGLPFAGFIAALRKVPSGSFVWIDVVAINQHGDAGEVAKRDTAADIGSLRAVVRHTRRIVLYWGPADVPAPLKRIWCLYELQALVSTPGHELILAFDASGRDELLGLAAAHIHAQHVRGRTPSDKSEMARNAEMLVKAIKALDSKKAQAMVPADEQMIKGKITKQGGHEKFSIAVREGLMAAWTGYVVHAELCAAVAKLPGPSMAEKKAWETHGRGEFLQTLRKHNQRTLPQEPIVCKVQSIDLHGCVSDAEVDALAQVLSNVTGALKVLNLQQSSIGKEGAVALGEGLKASSTLAECNLRSSLDIQSAQALAEIAKQKRILMSGIRHNQARASFRRDRCLGPADAILVASDLAVSESLTSVDICACNIGSEGADAIAEALGRSQAVTECNLRGNNLDIQSAMLLAKVGTERRIMLSGLKHDQTEADLSEQGLQPCDAVLLASDLAVNGTVATLGLEDFVRLAVNGSLMKLSLESNELGPAGGKAIAEALRVHGTLRELNLADNKLGPKGAHSISEALKVNRTLTELNLADNKLGWQGAKAIADALTMNDDLTELNNDVLTELHLDSNQLGRQGAEAVAEVLCVSDSLKKLSLWDNRIDPEGAAAIAEALKVNSALQYLWLSENSVGNAGSIAIAEALQVNSSLRVLSLFDNQVGEDGAVAIGKALITSSLKSLDLQWNAIGEHGSLALAESLRAGALTALNVENSNLDDDAVQLLQDAVRARGEFKLDAL